MLQRITLENFMSFTTVNLEELGTARMIAVTGENGHGKSALLESLPYSLYGESRNRTADELIRDGTDSMFAEVEFKDLPTKGDQLTVRRGKRRGQTTSNALLTINGTIEAKGGNDVTNRLLELFNADASLFELTTFFGMNTNDDLMKSLPSARLEMLQTIAGISIYRSFMKKVQSEKADLSSGKAVLDYIVGNEVEAFDTTRFDITRKSLSDVNQKLVQLQSDHAALSKDIDRVNIFVSEKTKLQSQYDEINKTLIKQENDLKNDKEMLIDSQTRVKEYSKSIDLLNQTLGTVDYKALSEKIDALRLQITECHLTSELKVTSLAIKDKNIKRSCVLCNQKLTDEIITAWPTQIENERKQEKTLEAELEVLMNTKKISYDQPVRKLQRYETDIALERTNVTHIHQQLVKLEADMKHNHSRLIKIKTRLSAVIGQLKSLSEVTDSYQSISDEISKLTEKKISLQYDFADLKKKKADYIKKQTERTAAKGKLQTYAMRQKAYTALDEAWSRYGIPLNLLKGLRKAIEDRATELYQVFGSGNIAIDDIEERGKPGIAYVLKTLSGTRSYSQLSNGQKVMLYLPVRLAIADIIRQQHATNFDFLILDELTGSLRRRYAQTLIVSHTSLRNVFDKVIQVDQNSSLVSTAYFKE